jgi:hypothetical protein
LRRAFGVVVAATLLVSCCSGTDENDLWVKLNGTKMSDDLKADLKALSVPAGK